MLTAISCPLFNSYFISAVYAPHCQYAGYEDINDSGWSQCCVDTSVVYLQSQVPKRHGQMFHESRHGGKITSLLVVGNTWAGEKTAVSCYGMLSKRRSAFIGSGLAREVIRTGSRCPVPLVQSAE